MLGYVLYFFIAYSCGAISFGMLAVSYLKTRNEMLAYYGYFQALMTIFISMQIWLGYLFDLSPYQKNGFFEEMSAIIYTNEFIMSYLTLFALIVFCVHLFAVPRKIRHIAISGGLLLFCNVMLHSAAFLWPDTRFCVIMSFLNSHLGSAVMVYVQLIGWRQYHTLAPSPERLLIKRLLILFLVAIPAMFAETLLEATLESSLSFYPLIYLGETILLTHYFVTQALFSEKAIPLFSTDASTATLTPIIPENDLFDRYGISSREKELALLALQGRSNAEIAETLFISISTVKTHLSNIYEKFGVKNRYEMLTFLANQSAIASTSSQIHDSNEEII